MLRCLYLALFTASLAAMSLAAADVPAGFVLEKVAGGIDAAAALAVAPDGRVLVVEQSGRLRVFAGDTFLPAPMLDLSSRLDTQWERGLLGIALDPRFPDAPHVFVLYTAARPYPHHVLSRFTVEGNTALPATERILIEGDDQSRQGGHTPFGHQGGPICFGPDGKLYAAIGEQTNGALSQRLDVLSGKVLRLHPDGSIPGDNPFLDRVQGKYGAIWAIGLRNPFGLAFQPGTGRLFENDVGQSSWEEVNEILRGGNYGWPQAEGKSDHAELTSPIHAYPPPVGRSITGGVFYDAPAGAPHAFPAPWASKYFFLDFVGHWLRALDPDRPETSAVLARRLDHPVALATAPDGSLFVLNRGTIWRDGKQFKPYAGTLVRIRHIGGQAEEPAAEAGAFPRELSETGLFDSLSPLEPQKGFVELAVNLSPWQPGTRARRWLRLTEGGALLVCGGELQFPAGALVIQHFEVDSSPPQPFETQVYWFTGPRLARAAGWRWRSAAGASLVQDAEIVSLPGNRGGQWISPGPDEALNVDLAFTGFLLPASVRQLHCGQQLERWNERGWLSPKLTAESLAKLPRLAALNDSGASLEDRVRSYLDVNCSGCHRPGGPSRGNYDARFSTPLARQNLINGDLLAGDLGIAGAKVIVPGHPEKSVLYQRLLRRDGLRMPPAVVLEGEAAPELQPVLPILEEWIRSLR